MEAASGTARPTGVATVILASPAAVLLTISDALWVSATSEDVAPVLAWMVGWVLLAWAVVLAGFTTTHLARRLRSGRRPHRSDPALLMVGVGLIVVLVLDQPFWGSGGGHS